MKGIKGNQDTKVCSLCIGSYHYQCLGITAENFHKESKQAKSNWKCPDCKGTEKRGDHTPVSKQTISSPRTDDAIMEDLKSYFDKRLKEETATILSQVKQQMALENKAIYSVIEELKSNVGTVCSQYEELRNALSEKSQMIDNLKTENRTLQLQLDAINSQINTMEQQSRACNVEIQCVPENRNENLLTVIKQLGNIISRPLDDSEIMNIHRVPKINQASERPRAIVAKLVSPRVRDELLAAVKQFNRSHESEKLHSGHLGYADEKHPVYVTEHLSPANKKLHAAVRAAAKEKQYQFVWVRNGKIFVRKNTTSRSLVISTVDAIKRL